MISIEELSRLYDWEREILSVQPRQSVYLLRVTSAIGSEQQYKNKMRYYPHNNFFGSADIQNQSYQTITELTIPITSSREDDLTKLAEKKGFQIETQALFQTIPPSVRILRKVTEGEFNLDALEKDAKVCVRSLRTMGCMPQRLYSALVVPNSHAFMMNLVAQRVYNYGINCIELILSIKANSYKDLLNLNIYDQVTTAVKSGAIVIYYYKNQSDPADIYRVNIRLSCDPYQVDRTTDKLRLIRASLTTSARTELFPLEERLQILNRIKL